VSEFSGGADPKISAKPLRVICACVLLGIMVAGLWPFHSPKNEVTWVSHGKGLRFGKYGTVVSAGLFQPDWLHRSDSCSVEIRLEPRGVQGMVTILAFYRRTDDIVPFMIRQSLGDLELLHTTERHFAKRTRIYVNDVFGTSKSVFLTVSSGATGTSIYTDGVLVKKTSSFILSDVDLTGQLILGNTPTTTDNWGGQVNSLAVYNRELSAREVVEHFVDWTAGTQAELAKTEGVTAIYLLNENRGRVAHNQVSSTTDLVIPERFFILHEQFLERPWDEYRSDWTFWKDVAVNIVGFIPLGFFFSVYLYSIRNTKRVLALTIALGFIVSLTIEVLQAFLPTRNSGMTDLITNTLGTGVGLLIYRCTSYSQLLRK
jgi:hypothetical protein